MEHMHGAVFTDIYFAEWKLKINERLKIISEAEKENSPCQQKMSSKEDSSSDGGSHGGINAESIKKRKGSHCLKLAACPGQSQAQREISEKDCAKSSRASKSSAKRKKGVSHDSSDEDSDNDTQASSKRRKTNGNSSKHLKKKEMRLQKLRKYAHRAGIFVNYKKLFGDVPSTKQQVLKLESFLEEKGLESRKILACSDIRCYRLNY